MKLTPQETERALSSPSKGLRAALIYGPDEGLVRARRNALLTGLGVDRTDVFACTELEADAVLETPSLLFEALQAISLMGNTPCVLVRNSGNRITDIVKSALGTPACTNPLILIAGDLAKGTLRTLFEDAKRKDCIAIACYHDGGGELAVIIRKFLQENQIQASPPAFEVLCALLGNDRAVTLGELEKLDLYLGKERRLEEETVLALLSDNQQMLLSDAALAWISGDIGRFLTLADRLFRAGEHPVALIRVLLGTILRLLTIQQKLAEGANPEQAMMAARPPVFYKEKLFYQKALKRWSLPALMQLISHLQQLETSLKRTQVPELLLMQGLSAYHNTSA